MSTNSRRAVGLAAMLVAGAVLSHGAEALAAFTVTSPDSLWAPAFPSGTNDYFSDQQTGQGQSDLVGDATHPDLYWHFDPGSAADATDGTLYFRARIAGKDRTANWSFNNVLLVGLDFATPSYGKMDLFILCDAGKSVISVNGAGSGANTSPSTTTVGSPIGNTYAFSASNYNFAYVSSTIDNTSTNPVLDLDGNGATDGYVSFAIPFHDVVVAAQTPYGSRDGGPGLTNVSELTPIAFGVGTSTQTNAFNEDVGGIDKSGMGTLWTQFETSPLSAAAMNSIPEPMSIALLSSACLLGLMRRQRR